MGQGVAKAIQAHNPIYVQHLPRQTTVDKDAPGVNDDWLLERHDARATAG